MGYHWDTIQNLSIKFGRRIRDTHKIDPPLKTNTELKEMEAITYTLTTNLKNVETKSVTRYKIKTTFTTVIREWNTGTLDTSKSKQDLPGIVIYNTSSF